MRLGIGVVTYNRFDLLTRVIEAVEKYTNYPYALVVADDGGTDGSARYLEDRNIPAVGQSNRGIAWNKNRALFYLREQRACDVIIMLEDDTAPTELGWQFPWMRAAELHGYVTYAHPKVHGGIIAGSGTPNDPFACRNITSQCAAVTAEALDTVGYFDTRFKGYGVEDGEWTTRLRRSGFGIRRVPMIDEVTNTNVMIGSGVETFEAETYRDNESVARNRELFQRVKQDPIPRRPWIDDSEHVTLLAEMAAPSAIRSGSDPWGALQMLPYPYLANIPRIVARAASLAFANRELPSVAGEMLSVTDDPIRTEQMLTLQTEWQAMDTPPVIRLARDTPSRIAGLAALNRMPLAVESDYQNALGLLSFNFGSVDIPGYAASVLDRNFDIAMDRFVMPAVNTYSPWPPSRAYLNHRFAPDGEIALLVSTLEPDVAKIGLTGNVGDNFGLHATRELTDCQINPVGLWADKTMPAMLSIGSFIQHARDRAIVWGTGSVTAEPWKDVAAQSGSFFLGVRGPRTREHLLRRFNLAPPVTGDPGMLIAEMVPDPGIEADIDVGFILHGLDREEFKRIHGTPFLIDNRSSYQTLVKDMRRCSRIVTSSLHGWIFSHALGIPAAVVKITDRIPGGEFKFRDYAQSVGLYEFDQRIDLAGTRNYETTEWIDLVDRSALKPVLDTAPLKATFPFPKGEYIA